MVKVSILGWTAENTKENGETIKCTAKVNLFGQTGVSTLVNTMMTRNMVTDSSFGQMAGVTEVNGETVNKMGKLLTFQAQE